METAIHKTAKISTDLFIVLFGLWTLSSHIAVIFQLPFNALAHVFPLLFGSGLFFLIKTGFFSDWIIRQPKEKPNTITITGFLLVVLIVIFFALFANKHNFDDAHYICMAVDMVDHPEKPLLLMDPLGFFEGAPLLITVYKAQSIESFCAGISSLTGVPVIYVFHFFLPVVGLLLSVMAYLLLFRVLIPHKAMLATIISFVLIYAVSVRAFGNITFIRMHQGKGFLLGVFIPLILAFGLKAAKDNKRRDWIVLALAQVSAMGMNATAIWLAPLLATLAIISGTLATKPPYLFRNIISGILSSVYVLFFGVYLIAFFQMPPFYVSTEVNSLMLIGKSIKISFGDGAVMYLILFIIFFTWYFALNRITRILCIVLPAFLLIIFYNPLFAGFMAEYVISEQTYWRVAWLIPIQLFLGVIGVWALEKDKKRWIIVPKLALVVAIFLVFIVASPYKTRVFAKDSLVVVKRPELKVSDEYKVAERINEILNENDYVISPNEISIWLSTQHNHPQTLVYRRMFGIGILYKYASLLAKGGENELAKFLAWAGWYQPTGFQYPSKTPLARKIRKMEEETGIHKLRIILNAEFKLTLKGYISGKTRPKNALEYFAKGLDFYHITAVCLPEKLKWKSEVVEILDEKEFTLIESLGKFELWKNVPHKIH